ncbi:T9SS type B sorting domain-containing protein [Flavobacterium sp. 245]|uniref:T9SS type B sorting domain-containing protein n=1 Tax=Flavobacterium sp. 245 TaxID=2512115 RepID=UPI00105F5BF2|nr:T9SS type B sorting domain-containing protein [Flavobacterium sp. 245]TDP04226.1 gliding motility-associated-like protein [Flavobacterium sp. 245]
MKKPTILKIAILLLLFLQADIVFSQNAAQSKDFTREYNKQLRGDILTIGNNILNRGTKKSDGTYSVSPNTDYNGTDYNGNFDMYYINVDPVSNNSDPIFSSSSATLTIPNSNAPGDPCYKVAYAALYWSGILKTKDNSAAEIAKRKDINKVKFKIPNGAYQDIVGTLIHDIPNPTNGINPDKTQAYACWAVVTDLLNAKNPDGKYTVANVIATQGVEQTNGETGLSAGWSLFIVYEDANLATKSISTFNGFKALASNQAPLTTKVTGFTTPAKGTVNARFAFAALEGDRGYRGDYLSINGKKITPTIRPLVNGNDNFFNSTINSLNTAFIARDPKSSNTLGFDAGVIDLDPDWGVITNNQTSADITLGTNQDVYIYYFTAFSVDVIAPKVVLTKAVHDAGENDMSNKNVTLSQELRYTLGFKNEGNDSATEFTITDQLPVNTNFNFPGDIFELPSVMTIANNVTYNAATRTITFKVPNSLVEKNDPKDKIRFKVHVVDDCATLTDACNNVIKNSAFSSYRGNPAAGGGGNETLFEDQSYASITGCNISPQSTNFLVGLDACKNRKAEICLSEMEISASGGYTTYKWATSSSYSPVLGTNQKLKITGPGTYYVYSTKTGCPDFEEIITVTDGGGVKANPIIKYADNKDSNGIIAPCDIDGKPLPKIFLCGANDSRLFNLELPLATVVWEKTSCVRPPLSELSELCADERASCTWISAGANGSLFTASEAGYYRVTITSGGCVNRYYFNVYKSDVAINETHKNILCTTPGSITVDKLTGYEFSLTHVLIPASSSTTTAWDDNNVFTITQEGNYVVNYRLKNVNPTCAYKTNQIIITKDDFTAGIDNPNENPLCFGDKGSMQVSATSGFTNYYYILYEDGVKIQELGPLPRTHLFSDLTPGKTYTVDVFTKKADQSIECTYTVGRLIPNPAAALSVTSSVIKSLTTCAEGLYRITASGGSGSYSFFVDGSTTAQPSGVNDNTDLNSIILSTPTAKEYTILVRDSNLCETTYKFTVPANPKPVYTVVPSVIKCYGERGSITVNVSNANGYSLEYSIDNGNTFGADPTFLNLKSGAYNVVVRYTLSGQSCTDPAQVVTILPPAGALTASGGVSELAGCRLGGLGGRLRFTNVTGGKIPYQYSFDGGLTFDDLPYEDVMHGTYVLIVKDAEGCTYKLPYDVVLDPKPADPSIDPLNVVYNCNGTGKTTVTINNPSNGNYSYEYYLDNVPNTPITNNVFDNVLSGDHKVKIVYKLEDATTYSNLLKEDFGSGDPTTSPGIAAAYCFNNQDVNIHTCPNPTRSVEDNQYSVASFFWRGDTAWYPFKDHTSNGTVADGRYLLVNIGSAAGDYGVLYSKPIADVIPNQPVKVDLAVANLLNAGVAGAAPIVRFELVNPAGVVVARVDTGKIAEDKNDPNRTKWIEIPTISLNPGPNTNLTFVIRSGSLEYNGNDLLIDDISVYQLPKSCLQEKEIEFSVGTDKAFTVLEPVIKDVDCNGGNTGTITITAENFNGSFYYSVNGGNLESSTTSPVIIDELTAGNYTVVVQSDLAGTCSKSFNKTVGAPTAVTVDATVTAQAKCGTGNGATITATASGGTGPTYTYELRAADGVTVIAGNAFPHSNIFTNVAAPGTYTVAAKDINGCLSSISPAIVVNAPTQPTASLSTTSDLCYDANKATIIVTATGTGTLTYSLDGAAAVNTNTFTNVGVGNHTVVVTDSNTCSATVSNIIVATELKARPEVTKTLDCNTTGATIKVDIEGGTAPFTYKYKLGASGTYSASIPVTGTTFDYAAPGSGTYYFEISDANSPTSCKVEVSTTVDAISNPTVNATPVQVTCNGGSNGEVILAGSGGSGGYTYSFNNSGFTTTVKYTGLKAGIDYPFQVMDNKGCKSLPGSIRLTEPTVVQGIIKATEITCSSTGTIPAVVTVTASGGTGTGYQYSFNNATSFTTTNTFPTTTAGSIVTAYIKDSNNCQIGPLSITIGAFDQITGINLVDSGYDCSTTPPGGHVTLTAVKAGTLANISYKITAGPAGYNTASNTTGDFKSLTPGLYTFQATDSKTLCTFSISYDVKGTSDIVAGGSVVTTIKCNGGTGTIQFTVTGAKTSGYDYVIKNAGGTTIQQANNVAASTTTIAVASAVVAGDYTITATDRLTKCKAVYTVTLTQPNAAVDVTATAANITCSKFTSVITAVGSGGTPNYSYAVVKQGSSAPAAGAYTTSATMTVDTNNGNDRNWTVYIKDVNGCPDTVNVSILMDAVPTVTATLDNQCTGSGSSFTITANGTGGTGTLTYGINGPTGAFGTNNVFNVSASATPYTVWVKDGNLCTASAAAIMVYPQLTAITVVKELDCSTTSPDATITVTPNGGRSAYTYAVSTNGGTSYSPMGSNVYTSATAGTFLIRVTDANGCTFVTTTEILPKTNPSLAIGSQKNVSCNGAANGSVQLIGSGGSLTGGQNYQYSDNGTTYVSTSLFTGLSGGAHTFYVKDSKGCTGSLTVTIQEPDPLVISDTTTPFSCSITNTKVAGSVEINIPTGGTAPYQYSFNGGGYGPTRLLTVNDNGVSDQTVTYSVKDANGCIENGSTILRRLNPPSNMTFLNNAITCTATSTNVTVSVSNGVGTLQYETIAPSVIIRGKQTGNVFNGLTPGTYTFRVTDANGCFDTKTYKIDDVTPILVIGNKGNDAKCKGSSTGNGTYTVSNVSAVGNYSFALTAGTLGTGTLTKSATNANVLVLANVAAGTYTVRVTDLTTGCFKDESITIGEPSLDVDVTATATNITCKVFTSVITAVGAGGTPNYTYAVVERNATAPTVINGGASLTVDTANGTKMFWDVYVKDVNGCTDFVTVEIKADKVPTVTAVLDNQCTGTGSNFTITATGADGKGTLLYGINGANGSFSTNNVFNVPAGTYTVWVKDANNCTASAAPITIYPQLAAKANVTKQLDCSASPKAEITVDIEGGKSTYTYRVDPGTGTYGAVQTVTGTQFVFTNATTAGTYKFEITDSNSPACKIEVSAIVSAISDPTVTIAAQTNITCNGLSNGSVQLAGHGGSGGYTYSDALAGTYTTTATFSGLALGAHTFYVKDSKGCTGSVVVTITQPSVLVISDITTPFSCSTTNTKVAGSVEINVPTTGTAPYQYSFNGGGYGPTRILTVNDNGTSNQTITYSVRDANGCIANGSTILNRLNSPKITIVNSSAITCSVFTSTATVVITAGTGVGTLEFETIAPSKVILPKQPSNSFAGLTDGSYTFKVTDANGCYDVYNVIIKPVTNIAVRGDVSSNVKCKGDATGSGVFTVSGFTGSYSYSINGGTIVSAQTATTIPLTNQLAGTYNIAITDEATGCTATGSLTIDEPVLGLTANYVTVNANCKIGTSKVTVNVTGGTPIYRYSFVQDGLAMGTLTTSNTANLDPSVNKDWDVYVVDGNGCQVRLDVVIDTDNAPTVTASTANQCLGSGTYEITASATGVAPFTYSINGTNYQVSNKFPVNVAGNYTIYVKDANGCIASTATPVTVLAQLTVSPKLVKNITCVSGDEAAKITLTVGGGSGNFTYTSTPATGSFTGNVFTTSDAGNYIFTVTDTDTNCTATTTLAVPIIIPTQPEFTVANGAGISCNGDASASLNVVVDPSKGVAPFVINVFNKTSTPPFDYGTQTSGLKAGDYTITVTDANGCPVSKDITIAEPDPLVLDFDTEDLQCTGAGVTKGKIIINSVTGGTGLYNYYVTGINNFSKQRLNTNGSYVVEVVDFGLYQIRIEDANGCSILESNIKIAAPPDYLDISVATSASCGAGGGSAVVSIGSAFPSSGPFYFNIYKGSTPPQIFTAVNVDGWQGEIPSGSLSTVFTGLTPGVKYTFIVYDKGTDCYYYQEAEDAVPTNSLLEVVGGVANNVSCVGENDGKYTFAIKNNYTSGPSVDASFEVYEAITNKLVTIIPALPSNTATIAAGATSTTFTVSPLPVGSYYILVKEDVGPNAGCSVVSANFNIKESTKVMSLTASVSTKEDCNNLAIISAQAKDGTGPYTYQVVASGASPVSGAWVSGNTFTRAGSIAGTLYDVYAKDDFGCEKFVPVTVYKYAAPTIDPVAPICYTGTPFKVTITGTVDPTIVGAPTYSTDNVAYQASNEFEFNAAGTYHLYIKDGKGCTATIDYEVKPQVTLQANLALDLTCTANASITLTPGGGTGTYGSYYVDIDGGGYGVITMPYEPSAAGTYTFRVADSQGCQAFSSPVIVTPALLPAANATPFDVTCIGGTDGSIEATATSGIPPFEYQLEQGGTILKAFSIVNTFTDLSADNNYVVRVKDAKNCEITVPVTIEEPVNLVASAALTKGLLCYPDNDAIDAEVTVTVTSGGTPPFQYSFDNGANYGDNNVFTTTASGPVKVSVRDAHGCIVNLADVIVPALDAPTDMDISGTLVFCNPAARQTSTVTITNVQNGVGTPQFEILSPIVRAKQPSNVFTGLAPNDLPYVFQITDANGCTYQESYKVLPAEVITVSGQLVSNVTCNPGTNGEVLFTVGNFTGTYSYSLNGGAAVTGQTSLTIPVTGITAASTQTVAIIDEVTGCTATASIIVAQPAALALSVLTNINANCNNDAQVTVEATGGTAPYEYSFVVAGAGSPGVFTSSASAILDPATPNWDVYVKDVNGCIITAPITVPVVKDAPPTMGTPAPICFVGTAVTIDLAALATVNIGTGVYRVDGSDITGSTYNVTAPGTYKFSVVDGNGCESNIVSFEVKPQVTLLAELLQDLTCTLAADIKLTPGGGTGTYPIYQVEINNSGTYVALPAVYTAGTYKFRVEDSQGCEGFSNTIIVTPALLPAATAAAIDATCIGGNNGSIEVTATSGITPLQYQLEKGATIVKAFSTSNVFTGLVAGTDYVVTVKDAKDCEITIPVTVGEPAVLVASATLTQGLTCGTGNAANAAEVTVTVTSGGTPTYQYSFDGGSTYGDSNTFTTTLSGMVNVSVRDANGCITALTGVNIPALTPPTAMSATGTLVFCEPAARRESTVTLTVTGGELPLSYAIISPAGSTNVTGASSGVFTGLLPDALPYVFEVTDNKGCTFRAEYTVKPAVEITVASALVKNVTCNGGNDGAVKFTVANFTGTYSYSINGLPAVTAQTNAVINVTGLTAGVAQNIVITDEVTGCTATASIQVGEPAVLDLDLVSQTPANCYLGSIVTVQATGGTPAYKYAFVKTGVTPLASDYTTSNSTVLAYDDLGSNDWDVYVQDANLICSDKILVTLTKHAAPTIDPNANVYCYTGGPVSITITGTTDPSITTPPMYSIGNGYKASPDFTLNAPGTYDFYIKDGNGCIAHATYVLRQELLIQATLTQDLNCTTNDATITLLATQGTGTYPNFYVSKDGGAYVGVTSPYHPVDAGTYTFKVNDGICETVSVPVVVTPLSVPSFAAAPVDVLCQGDSNGSITITASNGVAPYKYSINGGTTYFDSNIFTGLAVGTYSVTVIDAKGCSPLSASNIDINAPVVLTATNAVTPFGCDVSNNAKDASVTLTAAGGTSPYSYSFDNGVSFGSSPTHVVNAASTINYVVVDFNGCRVTGSVAVPSYNPPTSFDLSATPIYCNTVGGVATVTVSNVVGGVAVTPYNYAIVEPTASATSNTTGSFANLLPGTYVIKVTDNNGCSTLNSIEVKKASEISVEAQLLSNVLCNGGTTGSIAFTISNFIAPADYTFALSPNNGTFTQVGDVVTYTGLSATNYTFTVTDRTSGCTDNVSNFLVDQPTAPLSFTMTATDISCNNKNATITVTAAGGTPAYGYAAVVRNATAPTSFSTDNKIVVDTNNGTDLAWDVYVKDFNGCTTLVQTQNISTAPLPSGITANVASQCPSSTGTYDFTVTVTSGVGPFEYSIGGGFQPSNTFSVNSSGSYDITVRDANGCTTTVTGAVVISDALDLQLDVQKLPSCDFIDGRIVASATGGSGNYRYTSGAYIPVIVGTTATFNNMPAGIHTITVEDLTTRCKDIVTVEMKAATLITGFNLEKTDVTCNGESNGRIIVHLAPNAPGVNDNPVYTYTLTGTTIGGTAVSVGPQEGNIFDNLLPGDYTVRVTSGRGCNDQADTRILQPTAIVVNAPTVTPFGCTAGTNTKNFASITVNSVTGGTTPYVLYEFTKNGTVVQNNSSNVYNETDLAGGTYSVRVFDSNGCVGSSTAPIVIAPFITMNDVNVNVTAPITCVSNQTIQVSVATTGGTPAALVYTLTGITGTVYNQTNPNGLFTGLAIGSYQITVFNPATGCTIKGFHYVNDANTFVINATPVNGEVCYGAADGSVDLLFVDTLLNPGNEAGAFTYSITGPVPSSGNSANAGPVRISGLLAGQYSVTAKLVNSPECTVTTVFTIKQPASALTITKSQTPITCAAENNDGSISVAAVGGWDANYEYELVGPVSKVYSSENVFKGLTAGTYTINVKDGKGCVATTTAVLVNPTPIVVNATASATMLSCYGDKSAVITVALPTGGQGSNYLYTLNTLSDNPISVAGPQPSPIFTGLGAGTYTVTVTDGFSCSATSAQIVISEPTIVTGSLLQSRAATCTLPAQLTLSATGGRAPYTYSVNGTTVLGTFTTSVTFNVTPGQYSYYVADANGCVGFATNGITVNPLVPLTVDLDVSSAIVRCKGDATAILIAKAEGGLGNYVYTLYSGTTGTNVVRAAQNTGQFLDLPVGFYRISVQSGDCSSVSRAFEITEPLAPFAVGFAQTNVTCFGESNGKMVITATGGTGAYKYSISPDSDQYDTKNVFENLAVGEYTVTAIDANGCNEVYTFTITQPALLKATEVPNSMIPEVCVGDKDGAFSVEISGGTAPYSVSLDVEKGPFTAGAAGQTIFDFTKLTGGTHMVYFKDAAGCMNVVQIDMPLPVVLDPKAEINYDCVDNKAANRVTITIDSSITNPVDVDYQLDGTGAYQPSNIFTNVAPGNHYVTARHTNGCEVPTVSFEIKAVQPLAIALSAGKPEMNVISVTGSGGAPAYEYSFNGEPFTSSNTYKIYKSGDYVVVVRDQNGCTATITVPAIYVDVCLDNYFTPNGDGIYDTWGPGCTNIYNNLEFSIFDRYGRVIAKYHYGQKWDGRYNGEELPSGDYWYVLKLNDEKDAREFVGHFTLYR